MKVKESKRFRKGQKRLSKRGKEKRKINHVIKSLLNNCLGSKHKDHALKGNWTGYRECHIEPDWLLVYRIVNNQVLELFDTGTHQDIFGS